MSISYYLRLSAMISTFCFVDYERVLRVSNDIDRLKIKGTKWQKRCSRSASSVSRGCFVIFYCIFIFLYYFFFFLLLLPDLTIHQIARNNGMPLGDPFRMLHAFTLAGVLHTASYNETR